MTMKTAPLFAAAVMAAFILACTGPADQSSSNASPAGSGTSAEDIPNAIVPVFESYESIRAALAADQSPQPSQYEGLAAAARRAAQEQTSEGEQVLVELSEAAKVAAAQASQELPEARRRFGEVSELLIGFLSANPGLARGRFVFECPMAKVYPKWVQSSETVSNPYMGSAMASCGSASALAR